ncbi:hypothetical protein R1flu_022294 [Riccia fluitans]|uniref:SET domain-containing protein n=1 Tax=Riccia fluitans TaxID=41844 RepID=A0ABD1ZRS0_9MARC
MNSEFETTARRISSEVDSGSWQLWRCSAGKYLKGFGKKPGVELHEYEHSDETGKSGMVLLARSDVSGWGVFLKEPASANDFLGEYTGELLPPFEANERGRIYDKVNLSFLFQINEELIIDAYRFGNKFKFANDSSKPNCYAKVLKVAGQHRVGLFAKRRIEPGEELLFDYGKDYPKQWLDMPKDKKFGVERSNCNEDDVYSERGFIRQKGIRSLGQEKSAFRFEEDSLILEYTCSHHLDEGFAKNPCRSDGVLQLRVCSKSIMITCVYRAAHG